MVSRLTAGRSMRSLLAASACALAAHAGAADSFRVRLTPVPIEASTAAATTGHGSATAQLDGTKLTLKGNFAGLKGAATVARLHEGAVTGVRGPAIADLTVPSALSGDFAAAVESGASFVVGVDTGLLHLAAAFGVPLAAIFTASEPGLTGPMGSGPIAVLGSKGVVPSVDEVLVAVARLTA